MRLKQFNLFAQKLKASIIVVVITVITLSGCSGSSSGGSSKENKYLGKLPSKTLELAEQEYKLMEAQNQAKDADEYRKLADKISEIRRNWKSWADDYATSGGIKSTIPFDVQGEFPFTVQEVGLSWKSSSIKLNFKLIMNKSFKGKAFLRDKILLYFTGVTAENEIILFSATVTKLHEVREDLPEGSELILEGTWNRDDIMFLEDLDKVLVITQEAYRELDREKSNVRRSM